MNNRNYDRLHQLLAALPAAALLLAGFAGSMLQPQKAWSDDRDLLGSRSDKPYVFFILDTSSSMRRWTDGAWVPSGNDDPNSKIFQVKKAVYEVIELVGPNALYGFATFDISGQEFYEKFYVYTPQNNPSWFTTEPDFQGGSDTRPWTGAGTSDIAYPRVGHPLLFGDPNRDDDTPEGNTNNDDGSCAEPEDLDVAGSVDSDNEEIWTDVQGLGQLWAFGKLGRLGDQNSVQWFKYKGEKYRLIWYALSGGQKLGDVPLDVTVDFQRLNNGNCSSPTFDNIAIGETITLMPLYPTDLDGDPLPGPPSAIDRQGNSRAFYGKNTYRYDHACDDGNAWWWEPAFDDLGNQYSYDALQDPLNRDPVGEALGLGQGAFDRGDMVPFDWTNPGYTVGNEEEIRRRLAPSILLGQPPDFRISTYFKDNDQIVSGQLPLKDEFVDYPPFGTGGGTPLAGSLYGFRTWFDRWVEVAKDQDPDWDCRGGINVIMLTDGGESCDDVYPGPYTDFCQGALSTCPGSGGDAPATQAEILHDGVYPAGHVLDGEQRGVKTWVIGYATSSSSLRKMAQKGGTCSDRNGDGTVDTDTECAFFPSNKDELKDALITIFSEVRAEPRAFVPAATPPRTFNAEEKIVLSNFVPVAGESTWDGHMNAFIKPLPLTAEGRPDTSIVCNGTTVTEACFLWDAGEELAKQAPTASEAHSTPSVLDIGAGAEERRVFYGQEPLFSETVPRPRRLFFFNDSTTPAEWNDLLIGLGLDVAEVERGKDVVRNTLKIKEATIPDPGGSTIDVDIQYVLGDVFHSDPAIVGIPNEGRFFGVDLFSTDPFDCTDNPGYRCYFDKHQFRRQVLAAGANDGQVHFFDLARFEYTTNPEEDGEYNDGTGRELFSYIPRGVLPNVREQAEAEDHGWDVDSPVRVADVFIDPAHDGIPTPEDREWRTLVTGGLRRGGRLYYALDMTHPDKLDTKNVGIPLNGYVPSCWNEGGTADCGPIPYGAVLWEFTDTWDEDAVEQTGHGNPDLGDTWSIPNTGMIRVLENDGTEDVEVIKFVSVFGGGLDPDGGGNLGNWLYMVDIETGQTIYKRRLSSSAASEPAAVDTDQNGFIDTIFIGNTDGFLYKADVGDPKLLDPTATVTEYSTGTPVVRTVKRVVDAAWEPFIIFDTGGRPIFFPPSVIFVAKLGQYALSFGTGNREEILALDNQVARFYTFVDDGFAAGDIRLPLDESDFVVIEFDSVFEQTEDLLVNPPIGFEAGWVLTLTPNEKVVTKSLAFAGILTFSSFSPEASETTVCGGTGSGKIFIVNTTNANPVHDLSGSGTRFFDVSDIVTNPYVESGGIPGDDDDDDDDGGNPCAGQLALTQKLMQLFPSSCRFANRTENIMTQRADTGVQCIAPVPVCVDPTNWKEF